MVLMNITILVENLEDLYGDHDAELTPGQFKDYFKDTYKYDITSIKDNEPADINVKNINDIMVYINKYANIIKDIKNRNIKNVNSFNVQFKIKDILIILRSNDLTYSIQPISGIKSYYHTSSFIKEFLRDHIDFIDEQIFTDEEPSENNSGSEYNSESENRPHPENNNISINRSDLDRFIDRNKNNRFVIKIKYGLWTYNPGSFRIKVLRPYIDDNNINDDIINERIVHMNNTPIDLALDEYDRVINGWIGYYNYLFKKLDKLYNVQFIINNKYIIKIDRNRNIVYSIKKSYKLFIAGISIASIMIAITIFLAVNKYNRG